jgi:membrane protein
MTPLLARLETRALASRVRVAGRNPGLLAVRVARRFVDVRVTGLAAEMSYYALLSLVPLTLAVGAALGLVGRALGDLQVAAIEEFVVTAVDRVLNPEVTGDVVAPLVRGLLGEERTGVAFTSLLITFWLASRVFRAAIRALDEAYAVDERRSLPLQWTIAYGFALGAVVVLVVVMAMVVVGPLLGGGRQIAEWIGLGPAFERLWALARWPLTFGVGVGFLTLMYRFGPNVENRWRDCLPGALLGTAGAVAVAVGFRGYLQVAGTQMPQISTGEEAVQSAAAAIGALLAGVLWMWLTSIAVLVGGLFNAESDPSSPAAQPPATSG